MALQTFDHMQYAASESYHLVILIIIIIIIMEYNGIHNIIYYMWPIAINVCSIDVVTIATV